VRGSPHQIFWWGSLLDYALGGQSDISFTMSLLTA